MPEEKKESFTFSDKIKSSKPAGSKSFAKSSSKIGRDGKPRQTLFERTRRDAPFFIAALVALLLLPFLYKYSGQSSEDTTLLTPGSEESMFDPERYGFDTAMVEDPDGQIAQLSGRSSFDLIRGFGNEEEDYGARDDFDFDASASSSARADYEAEGEYEAKRHASTEIDEEENITNIYKRRARAGTRAAFRRTPIKELGNASLRRAGGSKLGVTPWGGSIKNAASKVKASKPKDAPKPVSLQPLRAGGPARSTFGQGAAAAARKGLDNMGKANAVEALRDSYVKPVDSVRTGGLDLFSDGHMGGGGKLDHNINIAPGREPWWWDMMKTRMQKEWEARFNYKWGWINWATDIAKNILKGLINCLITGDDGGDMGRMFGYGSAGGRTSGECCGVSDKKMSIRFGRELEYAKGDFEALCKAVKSSMPECKDGGGYKGPSAGAGESGGFVASRLGCLGIRGGGRWSGEIGLSASDGSGDLCKDMPFISVVGSGPAKQIYYVVTARNYFPANLKPYFGDELPQGDLLCSRFKVKHGKYAFNHGAVSGGASATNSTDNQVDRQQAGVQTNKPHANPIYADTYSDHVNPESKGDSCVIFVQHASEEGAGTFDYNEFETTVRDSFQKLLNEKGIKGDKAFDLAREAFQSLDLLSVQAVAMKDPLAAGTRTSKHKLFEGMLPMLYWEFESAYLIHKGVTNRPNDRTSDISKADVRNPNEIYYGAFTECDFGDMYFDCGPDSAATAYLRFNAKTYRGGQWVTDETKKPSVNDVQVSATFTYLNAGDEKANTPVTQPMVAPTRMNDGFTFSYTMERIYDSNQVKTTKDAVYNVRGNEEKAAPELVGNIEWVAKRGTQVIRRVCPLNLSGDGYTVIVDPKPCPKGPQTNEKCCLEAAANDPDNTYEWKGGRCVITPKDPCPNGPDTNEECCAKANGRWDAQTKKCIPGDHFVDPVRRIPDSEQYTIFAPGIRCVPNGVTDRKARPDGAMTDEQLCTLFGSPLVGNYNTDGQSCKELWGFKMDSKKATEFVQKVKVAYNAKYPNLPIKFDKTYPQDSEFIDALNVAQTVGITTVSKAAVCELGRDFVRMSKDKHAGDREIRHGGTGTKGEPLIYRNELGAFLTYIHDTSILYPDAKIRYQGDTACDWRFQPYGLEDGGCSPKGGPKMGKGYAHNNYNSGGQTNKYDTFMGSLTSIMKETPLGALVSGKQDLFHQCGECKKPNNNTVAEYNSYKGFAGLLHEETSSLNGQGVACEAFLAGAKDEEMSVEAALKYIKGVCTAGLDYKPKGIGNAAYVQGQHPTKKAGKSGGNEITGRSM